MSHVTAVEDERIEALHALGLLDTVSDERFDRIVRTCTQLFDVQMAAVNLVDRSRQHTLACAGATLDDVPREQSFCSAAIEQPDVMVVPDATQDPRFADNPFVTDDPHLRFYAGQPLVGPGGHLVGTLCLFDPTPRQLDQRDRDLLRDMARWVQDEMMISEELDRAAAVQRGLLPQVPPREGPWELAGGCSPARDVGGDLYDWYPVRGGHVITVADVMGKGMPAAIVMATLRAVLRASSRKGDLEGAVESAAETMDEDFGELGAFATIFHALLGEDGQTVHHIDGGHGLALVIHADGTMTSMPSSGLPIGPVVPDRWDLHTTRLADDDHLVVISDGLLDRHPDVESTFAAVARAVAGHDDLPGIVAELLRRDRPGRPDDDETVLVVRCRR
jgi:hypothetical protein